MKIAFDHQIFASQRYGGVSRYFANLALNLLILGEDVKVYSLINQNKYLRGLPSNSVQGLNLKKIPTVSIRFINLINNYIGQSIYPHIYPDIIHETFYSPKTIGASKDIPRILTVYDMIHEKYSNLFPSGNKESEYKKIAMERANLIISISQSTKKDICDIYNIDPEKIKVVHLGFDFFNNSCGYQSSYSSKPYILYVGGRHQYKNFHGFLAAYSSSKKLKNEFNIIAFGGGNFNSSELKLFKLHGIDKNAIRQISGDDNTLGYLYKHAIAFIYPSLYEGFGLPPLESMAHDCPVICSNSSSIPEVAGEAAEYFEPNSIDSMRNAMEKVIYDSNRRLKLIMLGRERIKQFSWQRCAVETREIYRSMALRSRK